MTAAEELLRQLAGGDAALLAVGPRRDADEATLDRVTRALVQLAALLSLDATTTSLRWAVESAAASGLDDAALIQVLLSAAPIAGAAQTVAAAPRLALALDMDVEVDGWDGT
jgi:alkylhydroperoxidase/carboxymuconolactone decarboxylase family protein YurZ